MARKSVRQSGSSTPRNVDGDADDSQFITAVARGMHVLDACARAGRPLGNGEIAALTNLPAPTVSRITFTLSSAGYLDFLSRERTYVPGGRATGLAASLLRNTDIRALARPGMETLARDAHFNVGLGTLDGHSMVYLDAFEGDALIGLRLRAGSRVPLPTSAMGRAYLAAVSGADRDQLLETVRQRYSDEWPAITAGVKRAVDDIERQGFCLSIGDWQKDINGIAAPIVERVTGRVYAINLGGPAYMLPEQLLRDTLAPRILEITADVQSRLGT